jgi:hypothetical protein
MPQRETPEQPSIIIGFYMTGLWREVGVPIHRILREAEVDPVDMDRIVAAYARALMLLRFNEGDYPVAETVIARKIIEIAKSDPRAASFICARALKELGLSAD